MNAKKATQIERTRNEALMNILQAEIADKLNGSTWGTAGSLQHINHEILNAIVSLRCGADESEEAVAQDILEHIASEVE